MTTILAALSGCASTNRSNPLTCYPAPPANPRVVLLRSFNSFDELIPRPERWVDAFRGRPVSPFVARPAGLAYRGETLYLCDPQKGVVHRWNLANGEADALGSNDGQPLSKPVGVAVDAQGTVYVADTGRDGIQVFGADGAPSRITRPDPSASRFVAVVAGESELYAADITDHRVDVFRVSDRSLVRSFGGIGGAAGKLYYPLGVALDNQGRCLVSDSMNSRIQTFAPDGRPLQTIGQPGDRYGDLGKPRHLAVGPDGVVFVADPEFGGVHLFDEDGRLLMILTGVAHSAPAGVAVAPTLPAFLAGLVPSGFHAGYYLFVSNAIGAQRIQLYAVGISTSRD